MEPSPPPSGADGNLNGAPDPAVDAFLESLLTGQVRVRVDPSTGRIISVEAAPAEAGEVRP